MNTAKERVLLVENDPEIADLISRQSLLPMGFRVQIVGAGSSAIQEAARFVPDVIIANLKLPGLSGKDLLVALTSQGLEAPVIVLMEKGMEADAIQAFRLGASDLLTLPIREAEVISAVERVLKQVRARREREVLSRQLNQTNQELQRRVRELTTIFAIGKAVISITDLRSLMDKIVEGAVYVSEADFGWLLLRDDRSKNFVLSAQRNLPKSMAASINQPWDDGLSSLVALSGESLSIHGEPLKRFKASALGQAALVVPVKIKNEVVGILSVVRKALQPMGATSQALLEAVADYASVSIVNAKLFRALDERARAFQKTADSALVSEKIVDDLMQKASLEMQSALMLARGNIDGLLNNSMGKLNVEQTNAVTGVRDQLTNISEIADSMSTAATDIGGAPKVGLDLNEIVRKAVVRFQSVAQHSGVVIFSELAPQPIKLEANALQIAKVVDCLLSNAIRFSPQGGQITVRCELSADRQGRVSVQDKGPGIEDSLQAGLFEQPKSPAARSSKNGPSAAGRRFGGLSIGLPLAKQIVDSHAGKIGFETRQGNGSTFFIMLPLSNS